MKRFRQVGSLVFNSGFAFVSRTKYLIYVAAVGVESHILKGNVDQQKHSCGIAPVFSVSSSKSCLQQRSHYFV